MGHSLKKQSNPIRDETGAAEIIAAAKQELPTLKGKNGNAWNGFAIRYRNRLMSEAGFEYNEAYYAMRGVMYPGT